MPRKVNYGVDYSDDYDDYDEYDYDYEDVEEDVGASHSEHDTSKPAVWRCSVCTYDNDESLYACDICGVLRNPLVNHHVNNEKREDDMVSNGMHSSKIASKASVIMEKHTGASVQSGAKRQDSSDKSMPYKGHNSLDSNEHPKNRKIDKLSSSRHSYSLPASVPKSGSVEESDGAYKAQSSDRHSSSTMAGERQGLVNEANSIAGNLKNVSLTDKSANSSSVSARRANLHATYKPEKWMLPAEETLTQLNLAIVGHVDSGKSTLSGRLLCLLGRISQKEMHKYEKEAKLQGKGSFAYAWALDESAEERERGITMTVAVAYFDSKRYHVVILDSPGHKDFVPNLISGATQADAAILVIDASVGAFEAGMDGTKGQTREHAQLIRSFGVDQIIVAVNKMDAVAYSKHRFDLIKMQLGAFLRSCNFKESSISWVPLSAMENQNLVVVPSDIRLSSWYQGLCLLDAIDSFQPPTRDFSKPLLMPICDVIKSTSQAQVSACGKLDAGALRSGLKVLVMPSAEVATVRSVERDSQACATARAGDNVTVSLQGIDGSHVMAGGVLCHPDFPVPVAKHLELKVLVLEGATPILIGSQLEFHVHHAKEAAQVVRILSLLDTKTGKAIKKAPRCLTPKQSAVIEVMLQVPVCVEEFSRSRALGRVFIRALGRTIAVGVVTRIAEG